MCARKREAVTFQILDEKCERVFDAFIVERKSRMLSPNTITVYGRELRYFAEFLAKEENYAFGDITTDAIRRYMLELSKTRNPGGCHVAFRVIKSLMIWVEEEYEPEDWKNPIRKVSPPLVRAKSKRGIDPKDIEKMIDACTTDNAIRDKAILMFLFDTGLRGSELTALNYGDVDLHTGSVIVRHGKGDKFRVVFMGKKTLKQMRRYVNTLPKMEAGDPLFQNTSYERLAFQGLRMMVQRRANDAGLPKPPGLHDFRRAFARQCLKNGMDLITVSRLLGHSNVAVTQRYIYQDDLDLAQAYSQASPVDRM